MSDDRIARLEARVRYLETVLDAEQQVRAEAARLVDILAAKDATLERIERQLERLGQLLGEDRCAPGMRLQ